MPPPPDAGTPPEERCLAAPAGPAFDAAFFRGVLPGLVKRECAGRPSAVPVVNLHLADGRVLDLCHISHLDAAWFAANHFRDVEACDDMDIALVPYGLVTSVTLSLHAPASRKLGFRLDEHASA